MTKQAPSQKPAVAKPKPANAKPQPAKKAKKPRKPSKGFKLPFSLGENLRLTNPLYNGKPLHSGSGIVPSETIAGTALLVVIAIMAFLACLTLGVVSLVNQSAADWQNDVSREVTIQILSLIHI